MNKEDEQRIREIVREELAAAKAESAAVGAAEVTLMKASIRTQAESFIDELQLPDELRGIFEGYVNGMLGGES